MPGRQSSCSLKSASRCHTVKLKHHPFLLRGSVCQNRQKPASSPRRLQIHGIVLVQDWKSDKAIEVDPRALSDVGFAR